MESVPLYGEGDEGDDKGGRHHHGRSIAASEHKVESGPRCAKHRQ